jgi:vancomycin resistance protein YoaR
MDYNDGFITNSDGMVDITESQTADNRKKSTSAKRYSNNKKSAKKGKAHAAVGNHSDKSNFDDNDGSNNFRKNGNNKGKGSKKKTVILISSIAAAVVVAVGVAGFCLVQSGTLPNPFSSKDTDDTFRFGSNTYVSGILIADKTFDEAKALLEANEADFVKPLNLSIDVNGKAVELSEKDFEYTYDIDAVLTTVMRDETQAASESKSVFQQNTTSTKNYEITATVTEDSIKAKAAEIEKDTNTEAKDAYVSKFSPYAEERFEYTEAENGCKLNTDDLITKISSVFESGTNESRIVADVETVEADITVDDIKENVVKLSTYETVSYNTENGTSNMKVSLEACNGSVIDPSETWSFNECTGDSNLESNGYKSAHVISDGKLVDGIGGGICQSSSTIYNAAIRANMTIEERYNHKWASSYVPTGIDATIDYPRLDLKLSNPTKYQMFMECKMIDTTLTVTIWGYKSPDYDVITTENELTDRGSSSYTVKAWRVYYKDNKEVDRESLGSSTYDMDNGYIFYTAENDSNAKGIDYDPLEKATEPTTTKKTESSSSKAENSSNNYNYESSSSSSKVTSSSTASSSSSSQKQTEKPTDPPQSSSEAQKPTDEQTSSSDNE